MNLPPSLRRRLAIGIVASLVVNACHFLWWAGSSFAWGIPLPGVELLALFAATTGVLMIVTIPLSLPQRTRPLAMALLIGSSLHVLGFGLSLWGGSSVRIWGLERFAARSQPLIRAIEAYTREHGQPPDSLQQLFPKTLSALPATGVGSAPIYLYRSGPEVERVHGGNPWLLQLNVATGVINWDRLLYYPLQNYPPGRSERVAGWAYLHE